MAKTYFSRSVAKLQLPQTNTVIRFSALTGILNISYSTLTLTGFIEFQTDKQTNGLVHGYTYITEHCINV